ncbi:MAG: hypothetical protein A2234_04775 [Elusimicrobia bacterium RIFOXYA2_FULL_58_8]|nr:MAG: hypothetical protein A2285_01635 [Elusimicrobia bacterium RIFOXYA12_FULL_57_11]OGS16551.1 MAG: hypothetical protein A2234_04775 [Elusimicrobia bacterium RIFOXYA2_FULL_58_8]
MNMDAAKTDELINLAIAALPYRRPPAGFAARVMALAAAPQADAWRDYAFQTAGLAVAAWTAALTLAGAKLVYANLPEITAFLMRPASFLQAIKLLAAHTALLGVKLAAAASFAADLAAAAAGWPRYYEIGAALFLCTAAMAVIFKRPAYGRF